MKPTLYLIYGFARSGKNTLADWIVKHRNAVNFAFADKVKEAAKELKVQINVNGSLIEFPYWDGQEETKRFPCVQIGHHLQKVLGNDIWVRILEKSEAFLASLAEDRNIVITDCRYLHDVTLKVLPHYEIVKIYIARKGIKPQGVEAESFKSIFEQENFFDLYVENNFDTVEDFYEFLKLRNL